MSFVYAEKNEVKYDGEIYHNIDIFSDTKTTLTGAVLSNWSDKTRKAIEKYGFLKSIIIGPSCCISFAGNNTLYAQKLLKWLFEKRNVSEKEVCYEALRLHLSAGKDDIEFIICSTENGQANIICIKEGKMIGNLSSAWIGSTLAYKKMQRLQKSQDMTYDLFKTTIDECGDDSVGGFVIHCHYSEKEDMFYYPEEYASYVSREQVVMSGENIKLFDHIENGGYAVHYRESGCEVVIDFLHIDISIMYTSRYRYDEKDTNNSNTKHLLLPIIIRTSTLTVI